MVLKAVLFDLDETLLDRNASLRHFLKGQVERLGDELKTFDAQRYEDEFIKWDENGYVTKEIVYKKIIEKFSIQSFSVEDLVRDYETHFHASSIPFSQLESTLISLKEKSLKLAIISNGITEFQHRVIKALKVDGYFDEILISEEEGMKKPNKKIFLRAAERLGVKSEECLFVGDHPDNDVRGAEAAGMTGVWKVNQFWERKKTTHEITDLNGVVLLVEQLVD
ncbi:2-haloalkanoic acid dehalogenase [Bacillus sp. JCM 19045]|nr:2-haloalkanoic acid dehalogenase [Bacillus sp. JCM 19045]